MEKLHFQTLINNFKELKNNIKIYLEKFVNFRYIQNKVNYYLDTIP